MPPGFTWVLQSRFSQLIGQYQAWFIDVVVFLAVIVVIYAIGRYLLIPPVITAVDRRNPENPTISDAIGLYLRLGFLLLALPIAVTAAGFGGVAIGSTVILAAATLAVGVAGQDIIGNFVSGVFLVADPDFNVGDYIEWKDQEGTIQQIDLRVTRMKTVSGDIVVVPNSDITTSAVRRPFSTGEYRLSERVTISYQDDIDAVRQMITEELQAADRMATKPAPRVNVTELGDSAIELTVWVWVSNPRQRDLPEIRTAMLARIRDRLMAEDVAIAPANPQELSGEITVTDGMDTTAAGSSGSGD